MKAKYFISLVLLFSYNAAVAAIKISFMSIFLLRIEGMGHSRVPNLYNQNQSNQGLVNLINCFSSPPASFSTPLALISLLSLINHVHMHFYAKKAGYHF